MMPALEKEALSSRTAVLASRSRRWKCMRRARPKDVRSSADRFDSFRAVPEAAGAALRRRKASKDSALQSSLTAVGIADGLDETKNVRFQEQLTSHQALFLLTFQRLFQLFDCPNWMPFRFNRPAFTAFIVQKT